MIVIIGAVLGLLLGGYKAKKRGGKLADIALYAVVYMIIFTLLALFTTLVIHRLSV
ncbi:MAG: hypothetical protein Q9M48_15950 [Rhodobacterales bacterium]|nr:hypothetical protein [Rhodobacterales bacterium]